MIDKKDYDVTWSDPDPEGDLGVSSERPGYAGSGQHAPTGVRDTGEKPSPDEEEAPPEQAPGADEFNPVGRRYGPN